MNNQLLAGKIQEPYSELGVTGLKPIPNMPGAPLFNLLANFFQMVIVIAGLYSLWNILLAGVQFISAGGDAKKVTAAWEKITHTIIGLLVAAGSVTIAGAIGYVVFKDPTFLITPRIFTP